MMIRPNSGNRTVRGVSLIELLVSLLVISVLVALVYTVSVKSVQKARTVQCVNNLRELSLGVFSYIQDHNMTYPINRTYQPDRLYPCWYLVLSAGADTGEYTQYFPRHYVKHPGYLKKKAPYFCPENKAPGSSGGWTNYAMNFYLIGVKVTAVEGVKALLMDSYETDPVPDSWYVTRGAHVSQGARWYGTKPLHGNAVNVVFTDGHVKTVNVTPGVIDPATGNKGDLEAKWFHPLRN